MTTAENQSQADQIRSLKRRREQRFSLGVNLSYGVLFLLLIYAFSGIKFNLFGLQFSTISLDTAFIAENWYFIFNGIWLTILLSVLSIALATVLSLLGALGRLSKYPPA
ncbi:MAG TPA: hypothetical protein PL105_06260, partial [Caldilineaceae bacterium]|nr:hypothetical protein [Caldilineaceae bacterium]